MRYVLSNSFGSDIGEMDEDGIYLKDGRKYYFNYDGSIRLEDGSYLNVDCCDNVYISGGPTVGKVIGDTIYLDSGERITKWKL